MLAIYFYLNIIGLIPTYLIDYGPSTSRGILDSNFTDRQGELARIKLVLESLPDRQGKFFFSDG